MSMNIDEKEAIVNYIEFHALRLCESLEQYVDSDHKHLLYEYAYDMLSDIDQTIGERVEHVALEKFVNQHRR